MDRRVFGLDKTAEKRYTDDVFFEVFTEDKAACDSEPEETVDDGVHEEGREEGRKKTVINLYSKGMSTEDISKWLDVPPQYVGSVIADFKK